jgi:hypothetical protein
MSVKIQINSLEALERLIGNDNELEIQIRGSIVQEFTKKHLRSLATTELVEGAKKSIAYLVKTEFFEGREWTHKSSISHQCSIVVEC